MAAFSEIERLICESIFAWLKDNSEVEMDEGDVFMLAGYITTDLFLGSGLPIEGNKEA